MNLKKHLYLICLFFVFIGAKVHATKAIVKTDDSTITLDLKNVEIIKILYVLEEKTRYTFVFDESISDNKQRLTIRVNNEKIGNILKEISTKSGFEFQIINNTISVTKVKEIQQQLLKGKIKDKDGMPLSGATVLEKGTKNTVTADAEGNFNLTLSKTPTILVISYVGFETKEIVINKIDFQDITLLTSSNSLDEVIVTALGIKRKEKQLGFSQQTINSDNLSQAVSNNWSSGLKGKVAGLNIISSGSGPLNSQQIVLRGTNSLDPNGNNALIIVDGTPVNSEMTSAGTGSTTAYMGSDSPVDYGNGISDLNLEDIENVTVLKGPGASALYGSRAANGALIITTKSGKKSKGLGITYSTGTTLDVIQRWPDYQYEYGQGSGKSFNAAGEPYYSYQASVDGPNTGSTSSAYGPKFMGQYYFQYDPLTETQGKERTLWQPYKNNTKDYWRTGNTINNDVTLQGGDKNGSMRISLGHSKNEWIMPNTGFEKISASVNASYKISDKIKLGTVVNYINKSSDNLPSTGYNNGTIAYFSIFQNPNVDLNWYRPIWKQGQYLTQQIQPFSSFIDNPFLIAYQATNSLESSQIVGNINATIQLAPKFDLMIRSALNTSNQDRDQRRPYSINRYAKGFYRSQNVFRQEVNTDFLLSYKNKNIGNFSFNASLGGNAMSSKFNEVDIAITDLVVPNVYKLSNGVNSPIIDPDRSRKKVNSFYGLASISYKDQIFLDLTGRNDWSSTLPEQNNSFFYPSLNTSFILSDIFKLPKSIQYLKYRLSIAQVGNDTDPYRTSKYYSTSAFPSSAVAPTTLFNSNFKPEIATSFETGFEGRLFNNRVNFDATVYQTTTENQITSVPLDITTGYSSGVMNSGEVRNRGIELTLTGKIINAKKFNWETTLTWSKNWNRVMKLADGIEGQQTIGSGGAATLIAKEGGTTTAIYGYKFERSPEGKIIFDTAGLPVTTTDVEYIGDASPDWKVGMHNKFRIGNLSLNIMLDGKYGGIIYSQTHHKLSEQGKLTSTLPGREAGAIIGDGVIKNTDGTYSPNTTPVLVPDWYASYYKRVNVESNSFDASYLKLREVSLKFSVPNIWLKNTGITGMDFSVFGRDLAMISKFPIYDPETAALNGSTILPGIEMGQMPSPATYGFNLKVNF